MNIRAATRAYEIWLATHMPVLKADLALKHRDMSGEAFAFFRATFYRWVQLWPVHCAKLAQAPTVLSVADLHLDNFGTWRDAEGRLIWGINDFDEAFLLPYTHDLVRLATSAAVAHEAGDLSLSTATACEAVLTGYTECMAAGGRPFVLSERHGWLRDLATNSLRDPIRFWKKLTSLPRQRGSIPAEPLNILKQVMPRPDFRVVHRHAGLGSLGRQRFLALAEWQGGWIARETKPLIPSACIWEEGGQAGAPMRYQEILDRAVRATDPFALVRGRWVVRRLSPYCSRIDLDSLPRGRDEARLLQAMGWETGNIHLGQTRAVAAIRSDLRRRSKSKWLAEAAETMADATLADWNDWKRG